VQLLNTFSFHCTIIILTVDQLHLMLVLHAWFVCLADISDDPDVFVYTNQGGSPTVDSIDDAEDFSDVRDALTLMGNESSVCDEYSSE